MSTCDKPLSLRPIEYCLNYPHSIVCAIDVQLTLASNWGFTRKLPVVVCPAHR